MLPHAQWMCQMPDAMQAEEHDLARIRLIIQHLLGGHAGGNCRHACLQQRLQHLLRKVRIAACLVRQRQVHGKQCPRLVFAEQGQRLTALYRTLAAVLGPAITQRGPINWWKRLQRLTSVSGCQRLWRSARMLTCR